MHIYQIRNSFILIFKNSVSAAFPQRRPTVDNIYGNNVISYESHTHILCGEKSNYLSDISSLLIYLFIVRLLRQQEAIFCGASSGCGWSYGLQYGG
jgi:hypothetical protein